MSKDEFHALLRQYIHRQPFLPFAVDLLDGRRIVIGDPRLAFSDGAASTIDPQDGALIEFFCEDVQTMDLLKQETHA